MTEKTYGCSAVVTVTLRVISEGHWGAKATVEEVMRIGGSETMNAIERAIKDSGLRAEIIGTPKIGAVTWEGKP